MRKAIPLVLATSLTLALVAATAQAQTVRTGPATPPSATTTTTTSGPTSLGATGATATGATPGTTAGTSQSGTSSGDAFSGSSRGNAPPMGAASQNNSSNSTGMNFNANGERLGILVPDTGVIVGSDPGLRAGATGSASTGMTGSDMAASGSVNSATAGGDVRTIAPELDQAARRELQRTRRTVETGSQMMHSIAPRTNVDRTDQMPDDNTPLLSPRRP